MLLLPLDVGNMDQSIGHGNQYHMQLMHDERDFPSQRQTQTMWDHLPADWLI
jgi:hypothetical protein